MNERSLPNSQEKQTKNIQYLQNPTGLGMEGPKGAPSQNNERREKGGRTKVFYKMPSAQNPNNILFVSQAVTPSPLLTEGTQTGSPYFPKKILTNWLAPGLEPSLKDGRPTWYMRKKKINYTDTSNIYLKIQTNTYRYIHIHEQNNKMYQTTTSRTSLFYLSEEAPQANQPITA